MVKKRGSYLTSRDLLIEISRKFHATIHVDQVLQTVVSTISEIFPEMPIELYLSHDLNISSIPVKLLSWRDWRDDFLMGVFRESEFKMREAENMIDLAFPLRGNQGVYGVLRMSCSHSSLITDEEKAFLNFVAETAGSAFENAQLYQQSKNLIRDLRMINEISQKLNRSLKLDEVLSYITDQMNTAFYADFSLVLSYDGERKSFIISSCNQRQFEGICLEQQHGFLERLVRTWEPIIVADVMGKHRKSLTPYFNLFHHRSLMLVPLIHNDHLIGAMAVLDRTPNRFSFNDFKLLQLIAQHTSLALANAILHLEMERLITTDTLTGLHTRKYFDDQVQQLMEEQEIGSLILIDVDRFKEVNDQYGHQIGDEILNQVAQIIKESIRKGDIATRWGGEELAIYLPQVNHHSALKIAERIRLQVATKTKPTVTVSVGVSSWKRGEKETAFKTLFYEADLALYQAKNSGRNITVSAKELKIKQ